MTTTTWLILGFLAAAAGELTRELSNKPPLRAAIFATAVLLFALALADAQSVF